MPNPNAPRSLDGEPLLSMVDDLITPIDPDGGVGFAAAYPRTVDGVLLGDLKVYPTSGVALHAWATIATTGTRQSLDSGGAKCQGVLIKAHPANLAPLWVGDAAVTADEADATGGWRLEAAESVGWPCRDLADVFIIGTSGDRVMYVGSSD